MLRHFLLWPLHHAKHWYATSPDKPNHEDCGQKEEDDIEDAGVVPRHSLSDRNDMAIIRNNPKRLKEKLDDVASSSHGHVECQQNIAHDFPAVILAINVKNGQDNQIGKDEADHA